MKTKKILRDELSLLKEENIKLNKFIMSTISVMQNNYGPHDEEDIFVDCGDEDCPGCYRASLFYKNHHIVNSSEHSIKEGEK